MYEEIAEYKELSNNDSVAIPASDRVVRIDHNSQEYIKVLSEIDEVAEAARSSNSLSVDHADELQQRLSELEAGKVLMSAPQTNANYAKELVVNALKWIAEKIMDNLIAVIVGPLMLAFLALLGF